MRQSQVKTPNRKNSRILLNKQPVYVRIEANVIPKELATEESAVMPYLAAESGFLSLATRSAGVASDQRVLGMTISRGDT